MYSAMEYLNDLLAEGYSREEATVMLREEATKRKRSSVISRRKAIEKSQEAGYGNQYAYATQSIPKNTDYT